MKTVSINTLMVPLHEYATVAEDATLVDAIQALDDAQEAFCQDKYRHRAILVLDKNQQPIGKISQIDALKALEPKYKDIQNQDTSGAFRHFSRMFLNSMIEYHRLFEGSLTDLRKKAANTYVRDFMNRLSADECVSEKSTLDEAIHLFVMGRQQSLLVRRDDKIIGVLRLTDVFSAVFQPLMSPARI